ncbi:DUF2974 domain-containing protein, partial [Roseburia hominis]|nr:DUF2974 domain-containing protein [Roseburia hominis]
HLHRRASFPSLICNWNYLILLQCLRVGEIPSQLKSAAGLLNHLMQQDLTAHYYIYGHSLGAINAQYALAN